MMTKLALGMSLIVALSAVPVSEISGKSNSRSISDFSFLRKDLRSLDERVDGFINDVRSGNRRAFRYVTYETLEAAIVRLKRMADAYRPIGTEQKGRTIRYLIATASSDEEESRGILVRAIMPGIFNLDPRVRLNAVDFLRKLRPDASMQRAVKLAIGVDVKVTRYDHKRGEFVFRAPRILETVASRHEFYREKDIDWPTSFQTGGSGTNNREELLGASSGPRVLDGGINTTTGLSARRYGDFSPTMDAESGYLPVQDADREKHYALYAKMLKQAEAEAQEKYGSDVYAPSLKEYRRYPSSAQEDEEGVRYQAGLLIDQADDAGKMVPLGQGRKYIYINAESQIMIGNPWAQLVKLDQFITRIVWWDRVLAGQKNSLIHASKDTFAALFRSIDGEIPESVPLLSFATSRPRVTMNDSKATARVASVFIASLKSNSVLSNRYVILRALKDLYADRFGVLDTSPKTRKAINIALWEFRREANRLDLFAGRILAAESITVGKRDIKDWIPLSPKDGKGTTTVQVAMDLGFRIPNSEIRSSGFELIVAGGGNSLESKANVPSTGVDHLFNRVFFAYRLPNGQLMTAYNDPQGWEAKARGVDVAAEASSSSSSWVHNYEQMGRAQEIVDAILAGDPNILRDSSWIDVESAVVLTVKRVSSVYLRKNEEGSSASSGIGAVSTTFFDQLQSNEVIVDEPKAASDSSLRTKVFVDFSVPQRNQKDIMFTAEKREAIKNAALGGLFNSDPRVRLTSIHWLRRLGPDESMGPQVERARVITGDSPLPETTAALHRFIDTNLYSRHRDRDYILDQESRYEGIDLKGEKNTAAETEYAVINPDYTVEGDEYSIGYKSPTGAFVVPYYAQYQRKSPGEELDKLRSFIRRMTLVRLVKGGDSKVIRQMSRNDFRIMTSFIDDEFAATVPLMSFHSMSADRNGDGALPSSYAVFVDDDIKTLRNGLDSTNFLVQKGSSQFLIRFYNFYDGYKKDDPVKREIRDVMYFYKQDDIVVEEVVLAFQAGSPDGRAVILAGTDLSQDMNAGGERIYATLPTSILKDIRNTVIQEVQSLPSSLQSTLGMISARAVSADRALPSTKSTASPKAQSRVKSPSTPVKPAAKASSDKGTKS